MRALRGFSWKSLYISCFFGAGLEAKKTANHKGAPGSFGFVAVSFSSPPKPLRTKGKLRVFRWKRDGEAHEKRRGNSEGRRRLTSRSLVASASVAAGAPQCGLGLSRTRVSTIPPCYVTAFKALTPHLCHCGRNGPRVRLCVRHGVRFQLWPIRIRSLQPSS